MKSPVNLDHYVQNGTGSYARKSMLHEAVRILRRSL